MDIVHHAKVIEIRTKLRHILIDIEGVLEITRDMHVADARTNLIQTIEKLSFVQTTSNQ